ncbi:MAG: zinc-ribbon domain-containing protein [Gammaproteobacteria bacterium]|nr:zinc-ribbon domain-containing protein [Gammaproteobacteria bacterium]
MAIVKCPECRKPISDKANLCSHCGFVKKEASQEDIERAARIARLKKQNRVNMLVYSAMIVFIAGVLAFYFGRNMTTATYTIFGTIGMVLGGAGYLFGRIYAIVGRRL